MRSNGTGLDVPIFSSPIDRKVRRHAHKTVGAVDIGTAVISAFISSTVTPAATAASSVPTARNVTATGVAARAESFESGNACENLVLYWGRRKYATKAPT